MVVDALARGGMEMNVRNDAVAKELRAVEWKGWHAGQVEDYYCRLPSQPKHFRGLL